MAMSEAAIEGIAANGHRWKRRITIHGTAEIGAMNDANSDNLPYDRERLEALCNQIVADVRFFAAPLPDSRMRDDLNDGADWLETVADCDIEEVNHQLDSLYDTFDFYRLLVDAKPA